MVILIIGVGNCTRYQSQKSNHGAGTVVKKTVPNGEETAVSRGDIYLSLLCDTHEIRVGPAEVLRYRLMHYIDTHVYSMKHPEEFSEITGYSYGYLSTKFKRTTERMLSEYYQEKRLDAAALLVSDPCLTVTEVADMRKLRIGLFLQQSDSQAIWHLAPCVARNP